MLIFQQLEKPNFNIIADSCRQIFPYNFREADENFKQAVSGGRGYKELAYWIAYNEKKPVGFCGIYALNEYPQDAFLGWYGVLPQERQKGCGRQIYAHAEMFALKKGFTHLRLYTHKTANKDAVKFYRKLGLTEETYINKADSIRKDDNYLLFSRNLRGDKTVPWDNKNLYING